MEHDFVLGIFSGIMVVIAYTLIVSSIPQNKQPPLYKIMTQCLEKESEVEKCIECVPLCMEINENE